MGYAGPSQGLRRACISVPGLGLTDVMDVPLHQHFSDSMRLQFLQGGILPSLTAGEAAEWRLAVEQAESDGTFFISTPFHCAVGTKQ